MEGLEELLAVLHSSTNTTYGKDPFKRIKTCTHNETQQQFVFEVGGCIHPPAAAAALQGGCLPPPAAAAHC